MTLTIGLGTDLAIRAGILYLFAHALFKAGLFISVGGIDHAAHTRLLTELGGLRKKTPALFWFVLILSGSMAGLPPFAGFLSKELVLEKLMMMEPLLHDFAVAAIVLGSIGTVAYTSRFFFGTFTGSSPKRWRLQSTLARIRFFDSARYPRSAQPGSRDRSALGGSLVSRTGQLGAGWLGHRGAKPCALARDHDPLAADRWYIDGGMVPVSPIGGPRLAARPRGA